MNKETISIKVVGRNETVTFHLREITVAEDEEYGERHAKIADKKGAEKTKAASKIIVDAIADWSVEIPTSPKLVTEQSEPDPDTGETHEIEVMKELPIGPGSPASAVRAYFADDSPSKERMARAVIGNYRTSLYPDVTFVEHSA